MRLGARWALLVGILVVVAVGAGAVGFALGRHHGTSATPVSSETPGSPSPSSTANLKACFDLKNTLETIITDAQHALVRIGAFSNRDFSKRLNEEVAALAVNKVRAASPDVPDSLRLGRDLLLQGLDRESAYLEKLATTSSLFIEGSPGIGQSRAAEILVEKEQADRLLEEALTELSHAPCTEPSP